MTGRLSLRRALAVNVGKTAGVASRLVGKGGGTALPGLIASRIHPGLVAELSAQLPRGSIVTAGTNGKTTTSQVLAAIFDDAGRTPVRNREGSNLTRGVASSLLSHANVLGIMSNERAIGLFEVDEAALPSILAASPPTILLLLNLFRDQLDRYGEVATVAALWATAIAGLPDSTQLVINADDPLVVECARARAQVSFGIESAEREVWSREHGSDVKACPRCGGSIHYRTSYLGHLGKYNCADCDFTRPEPVVFASHVRLHGLRGSSFELTFPSETVSISSPLPGTYNVYNAIASAAGAFVAGVRPQDIADSIARVTPAFGRMELLRIGSQSVTIALAKNPTGMNEVLRTVLQEGDELCVLLMLNDSAADGRDVSWIWDADFEILQGRVQSAVCGGTRAEDMALRLKYAGVCPKDQQTPPVERDAEKALDRALALTPSGGTLFVIPTYTAMLDIRRVLVERGHLRPYWEK